MGGQNKQNATRSSKTLQEIKMNVYTTIKPTNSYYAIQNLVKVTSLSTELHSYKNTKQEKKRRWGNHSVVERDRSQN